MSHVLCKAGELPPVAIQSSHLILLFVFCSIPHQSPPFWEGLWSYATFLRRFIKWCHLLRRFMKWCHPSEKVHGAVQHKAESQLGRGCSSTAWSSSLWGSSWFLQGPWLGSECCTFWALPLCMDDFPEEIFTPVNIVLTVKSCLCWHKSKSRPRGQLLDLHHLREVQGRHAG